MPAFSNKCINYIPIIFCVLLAACSSVPKLESGAVAPIVELPEDREELGLLSAYNDPWEGFNRRMYYFNAKADEYVLLPIVDRYKQITPDIVETGLSNFFNNLGEISTFINSLLQFKFSVAGETFGRFTLNSTLGLAGLIDVATPIGFAEQNEDFGQTLGFWGVGSGPYLVLPLLGPSSLRDATGLVFDALADQQSMDVLGMKSDEELYLSLVNSIDARARLPFRYYASGSAFEYEYLKLLYKKYREIQVAR
ncbi:VacJ family lipoprotein [Colwellia sp. BRX10-3]|uniref:MlaA family lipoprotein n=1 Tax=Colwellia sp. BRX10-3 TaxID=2759844 RepID=UPI0015F60864|nr:VacJ family lipoprotein [Colwellia sp. BRX10-3]MBA6389650.1 VacJ family lipoprotein [Colwellia sp. BRX10-3]